MCLQDSQSQAQPDELIDFHHLKARRGMSQLEIEDQVQTDLQRATGLAETGSENAARLNRVLQLTGGSCLPMCFCLSWHKGSLQYAGQSDMQMGLAPAPSAVCASHDEAHVYTWYAN